MELSKFKERVSQLLAIDTPFLWVTTQEEQIAEQAIMKAALLTEKYSVFYYATDKGAQRMDPYTLKAMNAADISSSNSFMDGFNESLSETTGYQYRDKMPTAQALNDLADYTNGTVIVMRNVTSLYRDVTMQRSIIDYSIRQIHQKDVHNLIVMITPDSSVPDMLTESAAMLELPLLNEKENLRMLAGFMKSNNVKTAGSPYDVAKAMTGLTTHQSLTAIHDSVNVHGNIRASVINDVRVQVLKQSAILTYVEPHKTLDTVGGHQRLKDWIVQAKKCMTPEAAKFGIRPTKGLIAMGLAGTGKTAISEAIANYFGVPFIIFDLSKVMGGIVGQSEQTARRAFETIKAIGKSVVLIDECDKQFAGVASGGSQDGGTIARVFDVILQNLQNNQDQFYILTANDISNLPSPLMRAGRLDSKWFFDFPNDSDRRDIFNIYLNKAKQKLSKEELDLAVRNTKDFTGAEIETCVNNILKVAFLDGGEIDKDSILQGIHLVSSISQTNSEEVASLREYARKNKIPSTASDVDKKKNVSAESKRRLHNFNEFAQEVS